MAVFYTAVRCMLKTSRSEGEKRNTTWEANSLKIIAKQPIHKGWSKDRKYRVKDEAGETYLLRISDISQYEAKRFEFDMMQKVAVLGVPMCNHWSLAVQKRVFIRYRVGLMVWMRRNGFPCSPTVCNMPMAWKRDGF